MIEIEDSDIKIYANRIGKPVRSQLSKMALMQECDDMHIRIMPNAGIGYNSINGFTGILNGVIRPELCGTDIGCGVLLYNLGKIEVDVFVLQRHLANYVPVGGEIHARNMECLSADCLKFEKSVRNILKKRHRLFSAIEEEYILRSLGTLGGGNHFVEIDIDQNSGENYLLVHTGSRRFGKLVMEKIIQTIQFFSSREDAETVIDEAYGAVYEDCVEMAILNRKTIAHIVCDFLNVTPQSGIDVVHNYAGAISRKGAISAEKDEPGVILLGEGHGALLCLGKGNVEWNISAPSGIKSGMKIGEFINLIRPTVHIQKIISPIFTYRAM